MGQFAPKSVIFEFSTKKRNRHFFRLQRLGFVQKIRKFQFAVFQKNAKNHHFWSFWPNLGQFWSKWAKKGLFSNFPEKNQNVTFLHSLRLAFMQKIGKFQCAVLEKIWRTETRERDERERRQRRWRIYRSESARWASDQKLKTNGFVTNG